MTGILPRYVARQFLGLFLFTLLGAALLFVVLDVVENVDQFIDAKAPGRIVVLFYLFSVPYYMVLAMPFATLLAGVFSVGALAKHNEIVAMKALGYSFYQTLRILLFLGFAISVFSFVLAETMAIPANRKKGEIKRKHLDKSVAMYDMRYRNLLIQEPPDMIIAIEFFNPAVKTAYKVEIQTFRKNRLVRRLDAEEMVWNGAEWLVRKGYLRIFEEEGEKATPLAQEMRFRFHFSPRELSTSQVKPDEMGFLDLERFVQRVRQSRGEADRWLTDWHMRISFPFSNMLVVLISVPLAYNRRKKSLALGFAISLFVCFCFFGVVVLGQTLGHNKSMDPFCAAWLGNALAALGGLVNIRSVRK